MQTSILHHWQQFVAFVKNPSYQVYPVLTKSEKVNITLTRYLVFALAFGAIFIALSQILEMAGVDLERVMSEEMKKMMSNKYLAIGLGVIIAPLWEEAFFRYPLGHFRNKSYFKILFYVMAFAFALMHYFNYDTNQVPFYFAPLVTLPQLFLGLLMGYVRIIYGFWYGVLLHATYNAILIIPSVLLMDKPV
jgi:uncharacterized protein